MIPYNKILLAASNYYRIHKDRLVTWKRGEERRGPSRQATGAIIAKKWKRGGCVLFANHPLTAVHPLLNRCRSTGLVVLKHHREGRKGKAIHSLQAAQAYQPCRFIGTEVMMSATSEASLTTPNHRVLFTLGIKNLKRSRASERRHRMRIKQKDPLWFGLQWLR